MLNNPSFKNFEFQNKMVKTLNMRNEANTLEMAQRIAYISNEELFREKYKSMTEYCRKELHLSKSTLSEYKAVVYQFCKKDETISNTGYCVKSLFSDYNYSQLKQLLKLTDEEIQNLDIRPEMSKKEIHKKVLEYKKFVLGLQDQEQTKVRKEQKEKITKKSYEDDAIFRFYDCEKCNRKDIKKQISVSQGLNYLKNMIVKDNDNIYLVVRIPKER